MLNKETMKRNILLLLFLCVFFPLIAQSQTVNIRGTVLDDATKEGIELASIRVLNEKDSSYVTGTATNDVGKFSVAVKPGKYLVNISFLGYLEQFVHVNTQEKTSIGDIYLKEDGIMLAEAMVEAKAPEIIVKGDTVEYNADSYKVQESAVLEDLIKKIPGAEIDADGKIKVNGKDISKILVDGKEFFSDDPKTASQNLPAKIVEKLQVLDKKSDMAQITGFDDGEEETVINLVVKPGMKQGIYGNALVGVGSKDRYEGNGFVNYAQNNTRISVLGNLNNNNNENSQSRASGRGVTATKEVGLNFATEFTDKLKWDGDVFYSYTDTDVSSNSNTQYIGVDRNDMSSSLQNNANDRVNMRQRIEWTPDSLTKIIFRPNISYSSNRSNNISTSTIDNKETPLDNILTDKNGSSKSHTFNLNGNLLVNRKLSDKGRSLTLEMSGGFSNGDGDGLSYSHTDFLNIVDSVTVFNQRYDQKDDSYNWRMRLSYLEPIGHSNFLELAYNINNRHSQTDKKTYDYDEATKEYSFIAPEYTRNVQNDFLNQNISLSFQSRRQRYNYTVGLGLEPSSSKTDITRPNETGKIVPRKNYLNLAPRVEFNYIWDKRHNLRVRYNARTNNATTTQLYDGIISQNGLDKEIGNPNLKPSFINTLFLRYQRYIPEKASSIMAFARFEHTSNAIVQIRTWEGAGQVNTYENINGNMNGRFRLMYNTPLRNKRFSINTATSVNYEKDNTFISVKGSDSQKNSANVVNIGEDLRLKFNSDVFQFDLGGRISYETTTNSYAKNQNQDVYNFGGFGNFSWYLSYDFVLESDLDYSSNSGYSSGYQQNMWLWNASLSKQLFKAKNATIRFKMYDILHERKNISRTSNAQYVRDTFSNSINSYFMVNFIFRFQSFKGGAKRADMENPGGDRRRNGPPGEGGRGGRGPGF